MKIAKPLVAGALLGLTVSVAQAVVFKPYYVDDGHTGKATVRATGGCAIAPTTFENAQMGEIYDSTNDSYVGWGVIDAQGNILAVRYDNATLKSVLDEVNMKGDVTYFEDFETPETYDYIVAAADCDIAILRSDSSSRSVSKWDYPKGIDNATLKYDFTGYTDDVSVADGAVQIRKAEKFNGSITFKGERQVLL